MGTIGRNQRCPCGSGKKYKYCHGVTRNTAPPPRLSEKDHAFFKRSIVREEALRVEREKQHGLGRPFVSLATASHRIVVAGKTAYRSKSWKTVPDFLMAYLKFVLGKDWWMRQVSVPEEHRHPIFHWYALTCEHQSRSAGGHGEVRSAALIGAAAGTLWLAYGLYLLQHNADIQNHLLKRLRSEDHVQVYGAIYEVWVASVMVWAGFEIRLEDETDGVHSHCEFVAISKATGKKYSVEAKVCDPGNLQGVRARNRIVRQLSRALSKRADHERIVFIDLNEPAPPDGSDWKAWLKSNARRLRSQERAMKTAPAACVFLTNYPYRYFLHTDDIVRVGILEGFKLPKFKYDASFASLREMGDFKEEFADLFGLMETFLEIKLPSTFDGQPSARAFGNAETRLVIGEKYLIPNELGDEAIGELTSAIVDEVSMTVTAAFFLESGVSLLHKIPINEDELAAYRESPDTFFGVYQPVTRKIDDPFELYEWMRNATKDTPRAKLLGFLAGQPDIERLKELSRQELLKIYCERCARTMAAQQKHKK